ncbi:hypothetical protein GNI_102210 [Gregarina niphandrodes]|uniref:Uncharacterized protein n=1 Tax=Gregarina niphandrodes TaxID=110365 RepID=A0A023B4E0_GRENI|nr:hypothetical protein GNI_102210 [Gregarina niphandrodes]EZG56681.1 hypothetical protein GNI_102210 [Gregarina niphandrodes]|eukprot:XP_011131211.1 hypothetical protein GNI_102210 [Gregarina niphandrodes]
MEWTGLVNPTTLSTDDAETVCCGLSFLKRTGVPVPEGATDLLDALRLLAPTHSAVADPMIKILAPVVTPPRRKTDQAHEKSNKASAEAFEYDGGADIDAWPVSQFFGMLSSCEGQDGILSIVQSSGSGKSRYVADIAQET